jgi:hypothetical protein
MNRNINKEKIKAMQYNLKKVDGVLKPLMFKEDIKEQVNKRFCKVEFMPVNEVKVILQDIYDKLKNKYPNSIIDNKICDATTLRQQAIMNIKNCDLCIVVGDKSSSNSNKFQAILLFLS